ncbi:hypothetical protein N2152v2_002152 [Parachlorella kessleri]
MAHGGSPRYPSFSLKSGNPRVVFDSDRDGEKLKDWFYNRRNVAWGGTVVGEEEDVAGTDEEEEWMPPKSDEEALTCYMQINITTPVNWDAKEYNMGALVRVASRQLWFKSEEIKLVNRRDFRIWYDLETLPGWKMVATGLGASVNVPFVEAAHQTYHSFFGVHVQLGTVPTVNDMKQKQSGFINPNDPDGPRRIYMYGCPFARLALFRDDPRGENPRCICQPTIVAAGYKYMTRTDDAYDEYIVAASMNQTTQHAGQQNP